MGLGFRVWGLGFRGFRVSGGLLTGLPADLAKSGSPGRTRYKPKVRENPKALRLRPPPTCLNLKIIPTRV